MVLICQPLNIVLSNYQTIGVNRSWLESLSVGVGMCGRAEMAFVLISLGLTVGVFDAHVFSVLIFTAFLLNLFTPVGLLACTAPLRRKN